MERWKIVRVCFIGGSLCVAVGLGLALAFAPDFWWLGLLAGLSGGYLSYEFREVLRAIPVAWRAAWIGGQHGYRRIRAWFAEPHPFFYPATAITAALYVWAMYHYVRPMTEHFAKYDPQASTVMSSLLLLQGAVGAYVLVFGMLLLLTFIGARVGEWCYWYPFLTLSGGTADKEQLELITKGYRAEELTYGNVLRWTLKGIGVTLLFLVWMLPKGLALGVCRFLWELFKLIHKEERVLCALDGTLGGAILAFWFRTASVTPAEYLVLVFFGGLLGAAFGVANFELISKHLLHLVPSR